MARSGRSSGPISLRSDGTPELNGDGQLGDLLKGCSDVFPDDLPRGLPPERGVHHTIKLKEGSDPVFRRAYRLSPLELAEAKQQVLELLEKGFIEPSQSPFGAPILFCYKEGWQSEDVY